MLSLCTDDSVGRLTLSWLVSHLAGNAKICVFPDFRLNCSAGAAHMAWHTSFYLPTPRNHGCPYAAFVNLFFFVALPWLPHWQVYPTPPQLPACTPCTLPAHLACPRTLPLHLLCPVPAPCMLPACLRTALLHLLCTAPAPRLHLLLSASTSDLPCQPIST